MSAEWLLLHGGALGDLVLTVQLTLELDEIWRTGRLRVVSRADLGDLSACSPAIVRHSLEGLGAHWLFAEAPALPSNWLSLVHGRRVINALSGAECVVHRNLSRLEPLQLLSFDPRPRAALGEHITRQWRRDLERQGLLFPKCIHHKAGHRLHGVAAVRERGARYLADRGLPAESVVLHPGSGGRSKCWPLPCFAAVARRLAAQGTGVVFVLGPVEQERWALEEIAGLQRAHAALCLQSADDLLGVLAAARAVVANDAGPAHLAALIGTPTVTIFGPTSSRLWHPLDQCGVTFAGDPEHHAADWGIAADDVAAAALASSARTVAKKGAGTGRYLFR